MTVKIYHNPMCSKSRQTLSILEAEGIAPEIIRYLDTPPDKETLRSILQMLGLGARDLMRKGEAAYKENGLADTSLSEEALLDAMLKHPRLIERPIVVVDGQARIGRPPEIVEEILP